MRSRSCKVELVTLSCAAPPWPVRRFREWIWLAYYVVYNKRRHPMNHAVHSLAALAVVAGVFLTGLAHRGFAAAQETSPLMKVDLVVPATVDGDERLVGTDLCVFLPEEATTVTVSRRALVPEAGVDRPLWMTIQPYVSTAYPLLERANIQGTTTLTFPELGYETCFSFDNTIAQRQAQSVAQSYKYFAQIVTLEVR